MTLRLVTSLPLLLACSCAAPPTVAELPPAKPGNVVTASTQNEPSNDSMLLEAKLAVCEKLVHETGEYHALEVLGFKSLLPPQHTHAQPKTEDVVGVWRSGFNPAVHEGHPGRVFVYEERIHYLPDGRVCGVQQAFEPGLAPTEKSRTFVSMPFAGTWKLNGGALVEDYSKGKPPEELRLGGQTRRSRKIDSLAVLSDRHGETNRGLRFEGKWPNYFETVPRNKVAALRGIQEGLETMKDELPSYCFEIDPAQKEKAEK